MEIRACCLLPVARYDMPGCTGVCDECEKVCDKWYAYWSTPVLHYYVVLVPLLARMGVWCRRKAHTPRT
jgi:hypothetical protein